jgi:hypothetical protein
LFGNGPPLPSAAQIEREKVIVDRQSLLNGVYENMYKVKADEMKSGIQNTVAGVERM